MVGTQAQLSWWISGAAGSAFRQRSSVSSMINRTAFIALIRYEMVSCPIFWRRAFRGDTVISGERST